MTTTDAGPVPRRLNEHILDALLGCAEIMLAARPDGADPVLWDETVGDWAEATLDPAGGRLFVSARVERNPRGRIDTRSLAVDVYVVAQGGLTRLLTVRARDLLDEHGQPIDARADARTLLLQLGHGIPDSPAALGG